MNIFKTLLIVAMVIGLVGCSSNDNQNSYSGPLNADGYPAVAGTYSFEIDTSSLDCTAGSAPSSGSFLDTITFAQSASQLNSSAVTANTTDSSVTIVSTTAVSGSVDGYGQLQLTGGVVEHFPSTGEQISLTLSFQGYFSTTSIYGNVSYDGQLLSQSGAIIGTCSGISSFSGDKIS